jgi:hypothetical protein
MITITPYSIGNFLKSNWKNIALILLVLFVFFQCNSNSEILAEAKFQKEQAEKHLANAEMFQQKNNYLIEKESKYLDTIASLEKKNSEIKTKIVEVKRKGAIEIEKIKKFKSSEIAKYIQDRYKTDQNNVSTASNGTIISDTIAKKIIVEVTEGDICQEEVFGLNEIIYNDKKIFEQKDGIISNVKEQNVNLLSAIDEYKAADELKSNALENTEKAFKKEKNKKNFWKLTAIGIGAVSGYLLIAK